MSDFLVITGMSGAGRTQFGNNLEDLGWFVIDNLPPELIPKVADLAFGLLIDAARQIAAGDRFVRRGAWSSAKYPMTTRVSGKKLGIFGMGRIGSTIARRSSGFDMSVRYTNRNPVAGSPHTFEPSLIELARWSDFLVIAAAGGAGTHHLVNQAVLQAFWQQLQARQAYDQVGVTYSGCLGPCDGGVNVVVFPDSVLYSRVTPDDVPEIFEKHLLGGEVVTRLAASAGSW